MVTEDGKEYAIIQVSCRDKKQNVPWKKTREKAEEQKWTEKIK